MSKDDDKTFHVESHNQQGGITAGVVNVNQNRTIDSTSQILGYLLNELEKYKNQTLHVTATMGDGESVHYAEHVQAFLRANGFQVDDFISQVVWASSMPAISYNDKNNKISVNIGSNV